MRFHTQLEQAELECNSGHVSPQSLKAYVHLDVAAGREAIERTMAGIVGGANGRQEQDR